MARLFAAMLLAPSPASPSATHFATATNSPLPSRRSLRDRRGFTLTEVIISALIFALLATGIFASAIYVRRQAEASVRESIALAVSTGFLEQLFACDFPIIATHIENRALNFPFVSRDGQALDQPRGLATMAATDWGQPIEVPLVDRRDASGNAIRGPRMRLWFIPAVERSVDTPGDAVDIRIRFRWDNGQSGRTGVFPERTLYVVRTRVST